MSDKDDELFDQMKNRQLNKQVRITSDHRAGTLQQKNRSLYDKSAIQKDMQEIDELMTGNLNAEDRFNLEVVRGRNMSSCLCWKRKPPGIPSR